MILLEMPCQIQATWIERPNRFLGIVRFQDGTQAKVHVRDPGRLTELLFPGNKVIVNPAPGAAKERKTRFDLVAAAYEDQWVLVNSGYHPAIAGNMLSEPSVSPFVPLRFIRSEVRYGESRLDFLLKLGNKDLDRVLLEVKGCTLARDGMALFPDAPTIRGRRHIQELMKAMDDGYRTALLVLVFRQDASCFSPNRDTDPEFAQVFAHALEMGVECHPVKLSLTVRNGRGEIVYLGPLPVVI